MTKNELQELQDYGIPVFGDLDYRDKDGPQEDAELSTFFNQLKNKFPQYAAIALHIPNEEKRKTHEEQAKLKAKKLKGGFIKGASDIVLPGGPSLVMEMKREDHTKSHMQDGQIEYLKAAKDAGAVVTVVLGWKHALKFVEIWHCNTYPVAVYLSRSTNKPHTQTGNIIMSSKALFVAILTAALEAAKNFKENATDPVANGTAGNEDTAGGRAARGSRAARTEEKPETETAKPSGRASRGSRNTAEAETTTTTRTPRARKSSPVNDNAEQALARKELLEVANDLTDIPESIKWAADYLDRLGCKLVQDVPSADVEQALEDFHDECQLRHPELYKD